jgi:hypothetical protein
MVGLADLLGRERHIAVVDGETTELNRTDPIVEVAVVTAKANGVIEGRFDTRMSRCATPAQSGFMALGVSRRTAHQRFGRGQR